MKPILEVKNLCFSYPDNSEALSDVSFSIEHKAKVFFHGQNGAGKTTLFQCLNGLLKIKKGIIIIDGIQTKSEKERMKKISIVFQNANDQIIAGSVFDEVSFGAVNMGYSKDEVIRRTERAMEIMDITHLRDKPPHFLSYGQKKRVTIASILSMDSEIIILDEPTAGLDTKQTEELVNILDNLANEGKTLLISTHDADFSFRCADKIIVLDEGKIICDDAPLKAFKRQDVLNKTGLLKPVIMEVYENLEKIRAVNGAETPRNRRQLFDAIARKEQQR